jgi:hypothetical protein
VDVYSCVEFFHILFITSIKCFSNGNKALEYYFFRKRVLLPSPVYRYYSD